MHVTPYHVVVLLLCEWSLQRLDSVSSASDSAQQSAAVALSQAQKSADEAVKQRFCAQYRLLTHHSQRTTWIQFLFRLIQGPPTINCTNRHTSAGEHQSKSPHEALTLPSYSQFKQQLLALQQKHDYSIDDDLSLSHQDHSGSTLDAAEQRAMPRRFIRAAIQHLDAVLAQPDSASSSWDDGMPSANDDLLLSSHDAMFTHLSHLIERCVFTQYDALLPAQRAQFDSERQRRIIDSAHENEDRNDNSVQQQLFVSSGSALGVWMRHLALQLDSCMLEQQMKLFEQMKRYCCDGETKQPNQSQVPLALIDRQRLDSVLLYCILELPSLIGRLASREMYARLAALRHAAHSTGARQTPMLQYYASLIGRHWRNECLASQHELLSYTAKKQQSSDSNAAHLQSNALMHNSNTIYAQQQYNLLLLAQMHAELNHTRLALQTLHECIQQCQSQRDAQCLQQAQLVQSQCLLQLHCHCETSDDALTSYARRHQSECESDGILNALHVNAESAITQWRQYQFDSAQLHQKQQRATHNRQLAEQQILLPSVRPLLSLHAPVLLTRAAALVTRAHTPSRVWSALEHTRALCTDLQRLSVASSGASLLTSLFANGTRRSAAEQFVAMHAPLAQFQARQTLSATLCAQQQAWHAYACPALCVAQARTQLRLFASSSSGAPSLCATRDQMTSLLTLMRERTHQDTNRGSGGIDSIQFHHLLSAAPFAHSTSHLTLHAVLKLRFDAELRQSRLRDAQQTLLEMYSCCSACQSSAATHSCSDLTIQLETQLCDARLMLLYDERETAFSLAQSVVQQCDHSLQFESLLCNALLTCASTHLPIAMYGARASSSQCVAALPLVLRALHIAEQQHLRTCVAQCRLLLVRIMLSLQRPRDAMHELQACGSQLHASNSSATNAKSPSALAELLGVWQLLACEAQLAALSLAPHETRSKHAHRTHNSLQTEHIAQVLGQCAARAEECRQLCLSHCLEHLQVSCLYMQARLAHQAGDAKSRNGHAQAFVKLRQALQTSNSPHSAAAAPS